jgi:hypothetical protein
MTILYLTQNLIDSPMVALSLFFQPPYNDAKLGILVELCH